MNDQTSAIPAQHQRSVFRQIANEIGYNLWYLWCFIRGIFVRPVPPLTAGTKRPVVIVPGFLGRSEVFIPLQAALNDAGHPCYILPLGFQVGNALPKSTQLSELLSRHDLRDCFVLAHSYGGLIAIGSLLNQETRIRKAWLLGAPLFGTIVTGLAYGLALVMAVWGLAVENHLAALWLLVFLCPSLRQMTPGSDLLQIYQRSYPKLKQCVSVYAAYDQTVNGFGKEPGSTSRFRRPDDILFPEIGHNNLAMGANAIRFLVEQVSAEDQCSSKPATPGETTRSRGSLATR